MKTETKKAVTFIVGDRVVDKDNKERGVGVVVFCVARKEAQISYVCWDDEPQKRIPYYSEFLSKVDQ